MIQKGRSHISARERYAPCERDKHYMPGHLFDTPTHDVFDDDGHLAVMPYAPTTSARRNLKFSVTFCDTFALIVVDFRSP